mmetsp:Transcript_45644/g.93374  ORF Transcript_45644/g.93374 Transcript_45644/m.93374 type:complete len:210 (-) Transcript_45644:99-728(-)
MEAAPRARILVDDGPLPRRLLPPLLHLPCHAPRPQARQPPPHRRQPPQGVGLRALQDPPARQGGRHPLHHDWLHRHQEVHGTGGCAVEPQLQREGGRVQHGHDLLLHHPRRAPLRSHRPGAHLRPCCHPRPPPRCRPPPVAAAGGAGGEDVGRRPRAAPLRKGYCRFPRPSEALKEKQQQLRLQHLLPSLYPVLPLLHHVTAWPACPAG